MCMWVRTYVCIVHPFLPTRSWPRGLLGRPRLLQLSVSLRQPDIASKMPLRSLGFGALGRPGARVQFCKGGPLQPNDFETITRHASQNAYTHTHTHASTRGALQQNPTSLSGVLGIPTCGSRRSRVLTWTSSSTPQMHWPVSWPRSGRCCRAGPHTCPACRPRRSHKPHCEHRFALSTCYM